MSPEEREGTENSEGRPHGAMPGPAMPGPALPVPLQRVLDRAGVAVARLDLDGVIRSANPAFALACGRPGSELLDTHLLSVCLEDDHAAALSAISELLSGGDAVRAHLRVVGADGRVRALELEMGRLDDGGQAASVFCVAKDLTHQRRRDRNSRRARLDEVRASTVDAATGLPNRRGLELMLASAARRASRDGTPFALLRCEIGIDALDASREPDEVAALDEVIHACSERVRQRLRAADTVTRLEGTVLVVVAEDLGDEQDAAGVAYRLLSTVVEPVPTASGTRQLSLTIGVAMADGSTPPNALLAAAAEAASDAGSSGPGGFRIMDLRGLGDAAQ